MSSRDTTVAHAFYMSLSVLQEMELAALPGNSGECFSKGFANPLVIITGDAIRPVHPSHHEALNEGRPMLSCFRKTNRNTQHHTTACFCVNTNGNKYGTITYDVCIRTLV